MPSLPSSHKRANFQMPFGTSIIPESGVLFRLWAPEAGKVDLCLLNGRSVLQEVPMHNLPGGWFEKHSPSARSGDRYMFKIDDGLRVPDPASRRQAVDIHGPSVVCDPAEFCWQDEDWQGRPWEEAVIYELHVGTFSKEGTFAAVQGRLDYLVDLGVTAVELMPVAQFPGRRNWGYDGALLFAPCSSYGKPEELKMLIDAAHQKGLMVFLDVVYNHFGPEGNYLYVYAKDAFFTEQFQTPWGAAVNFFGKQSRTVRDFYIANALYWLEEFHLDGLRLDAVHAIFDQSRPDILAEIAKAVQEGPGRHRRIHLIIENDNNCSGYLARRADGRPDYYVAQWNDDFHHACHILLTGESEGYYRDYQDAPIAHLGRCLAEGFAYQGEPSGFRDGKHRGEPSAHLPPTAFVSFLQNHDQIGNRALGERVVSLCAAEDLKLLAALFLLAPQPPLLFMGEEFGALTPFYYFCDFGPELAASVTAGRRKEFAGFAKFASPQGLELIPDPNADATFLSSRLDWPSIGKVGHQVYLDLYRELLAIRQREIVPRLAGLAGGRAWFREISDGALQVKWTLGDGSSLSILLNLAESPLLIDLQEPARLVYHRSPQTFSLRDWGHFPPKCFFCYLE